MAKGPKPPKGGNGPVPRGKRAPPTNSPGSQPGRITADEMYKSNNMYKDMMWKPGQVKSPEDMVVNEKFLEQLELLKAFSEVKVESTVLDKYNTVYCGHETYEECMQVSADSNTMVLLEALAKAVEFSDMNDPYDRGFVNLLKIIVSLYNGNPYMRDRIGWFMWLVAKHISPNCYFPLSLELYYDPRLWHRPGQNPRPPLKIPDAVAFDGSGQDFGPEDDIWSCELPDSR